MGRPVCHPFQAIAKATQIEDGHTYFYQHPDGHSCATNAWRAGAMPSAQETFPCSDLMSLMHTRCSWHTPDTRAAPRISAGGCRDATHACAQLRQSTRQSAAWYYVHTVRQSGDLGDGWIRGKELMKAAAHKVAPSWHSACMAAEVGKQIVDGLLKDGGEEERE
eukprot:355039-Chlamydomonas_euryale.AAC.7